MIEAQSFETLVRWTKVNGERATNALSVSEGLRLTRPSIRHL